MFGLSAEKMLQRRQTYLSNIVVYVVILLSTVQWTVTSGNLSSTLESIGSGETYDFRIRPDYDGPPTKVVLGFIMESLGPFQESSMDLSLTFYLYMAWFDARLKFKGNKHITFKSGDVSQIWLPDIYFLYEKKSHHHSVTQSNQDIRVWPNGNARKSTRISLTVSCMMVLDRFPMDSQNCAVHMMSYAYPVSELWPELNKTSIALPKNIRVSKFDIDDFEVGAYNETYTIGDWRGLFINFKFKRRVQTYVLAVYIPSLLLIMMAWISFWIDAQAAPARVSVGVTAVLTATTMTASMQDTFPIATNVKAVDIWLAVCLIFVFLSLLEYALANYLIVLQERKLVKALTDQSTMSAVRDILPPGTTLRSLAGTKYGRNLRASIKLRKSGEGAPQTNQNGKSFNACHSEESFTARCLSNLTADSLDRYARVIFAVAFVIFNVIYWSWYLRPADVVDI